MPDHISYPLSEAIKAQQALREAAHLPPEQFPVHAFVGMISDEIEALRKLGRSDVEIVAIIERHSAIRIEAAYLAAHYATPEQRQGRG